MQRPTDFLSVLKNPNSNRSLVPLDDLLQSVRVSTVIKGSSLLTAPWGIDSPAYEGTSVFHFVFEGHCVVRSPDTGEVVRLDEGDAIFMAKACPHYLSDVEGTAVVPLDKLLSEHLKFGAFGDEFLGNLFRQTLVYRGGGFTTRLETLRFFVDVRYPSPLLTGLPLMIVLPGFVQRRRPFLEATIDQMAKYGASGFVGQAVATRLCEAIFVLFLRDYFENTVRRDPGLHRVLQDRGISKTIGAMQQAPNRHWTTATLSDLAGMSNTTFIRRFTSIVGQSPTHFLTSLRMVRARELLLTTNVPLTRIASEAGYESAAAFNRAFKRWSGTPPGTMRETRSD